MAETKTRGLDEAADALRHIDAFDRDVWVRIGMAIKHGFGEDGFDVWNQWSMTAPNYRKKDAAYQWRSFKPDGGITIKFLWWQARQCGWQPGSAGDPVVSDRRGWAQIEDRARWERANEAARQVRERILPRCYFGTFPYLAEKGFPEEQVLLTPKYSMILPARNRHHEIRSAQYILEDGSKRFHPGGEMSGNFYRFGSGTEVWLCEGFATALSIREALRLRYICAEIRVCFSASNIRKVAAHREDRPVYVVADNDENQVGQKAAEATGKPFWVPPEIGDANDFHQGRGIEPLADALRDAFREFRKMGRR